VLRVSWQPLVGPHCNPVPDGCRLFETLEPRDAVAQQSATPVQCLVSGRGTSRCEAMVPGPLPLPLPMTCLFSDTTPFIL
jgi:hypothetical protein